MKQYEIRLKPKEKEKFIAVAKAKLEQLDWQYSDLAEATGYKLSSIYQFFSEKGGYPNRFLAAKIANVLGIERREWK